MTGVEAGDAGPTGDLRVLLDEPSSAQVGLQHSNWVGVSELKDYPTEAERQIHNETQDSSGQVVPGTVYDNS